MQGSGPEGVDDLCFHTYEEFFPSPFPEAGEDDQTWQNLAEKRWVKGRKRKGRNGDRKEGRHEGCKAGIEKGGKGGRFYALTPPCH